MIICLCADVSDREVRDTIADGASTVREIARRCGAGAGCGACRPMIRECLKQCRAAESVTVLAEPTADLVAVPAPA